MDSLRDWILAMACAAVLGAGALAVTPEGGVKRITRMVCGMAVVTAMLSVAVEFDWTAYAGRLAACRREGEEIVRQGEEEANQWGRAFIEEKCEAYITARGQALGAGVTAEVTARWDTGGYWVPVSAVISGSVTASQRGALTRTVEAELGIPESGQSWREADEAGAG